MSQTLNSLIDIFVDQVWPQLQSSSQDDMAVQLNIFTDCINAVLQLINSMAVAVVPHQHFFLFDKVVYFLLTYGDKVELAAWTEICY